MKIPNLKPNQYILFSSADDDFGLGRIVPVKVKDILTWIEPPEDHFGDPQITFIANMGKGSLEELCLEYYDMQIMPASWKPNWEKENAKQAELIRWLQSQPEPEN